MKEKTGLVMRVIGNNFLIPFLEVLWLFLVWRGFFDSLMSGASGLAYAPDVVFIILSQIVILAIHFLIINTRRSDEISLLYYYLYSSVGLLFSLILFSIFFNLKLIELFIALAIIAICFSISFLLLLIKKRESSS